MSGKRVPRVFHGLYNIAGIPGILAKSERDAGYHSRAICFADGHFKRSIDEVVDGLSPNLFLKCASDFDIFNFHFGTSFFGQNLKDINLLKRMGKKVFFHFHGCDIRDSKAVQEKYPISVCAECWPMQCNANRSRARQIAEKLADRVFVSTPDLVEFVPGAEWLPQAVDLDEIVAKSSGLDCRSHSNGAVTIAHAPTSTMLKGTQYVVPAIEELKRRGHNVELKLITGMSHQQTIEAVCQSDIVIDQLLAGAYGVLAVEAMLMRKPTICYIREDLLEQYGAGFPIWNASPLDLVERIEALINRREEWQDMGDASYDYVTRTHACENVAKRVLNYYPPLPA